MSEAINGIKANMFHDEGAYARCSYCKRYSLDPATLSDRQPHCDCGKAHGWSGSFVKPGPDAIYCGKQPTPTMTTPQQVLSINYLHIQEAAIEHGLDYNKLGSAVRDILAKIQAAPQAQAQASDWRAPTSVLQRFGDAMQLLCYGRRPDDAALTDWLDKECDGRALQEFAAEHGPAWAQGIGLIDAALTMVDQPTEGVDHEFREVTQAQPAQGVGEVVASEAYHVERRTNAHADVCDATGNVYATCSWHVDANQRADRICLLLNSGSRPAPSPEAVPTQAARDVLAERQRQVNAEGWTPEHDDEHKTGDLSAAAACYALHTYPVGNVGDYLRFWPWASEWWKPKDRRRNLIKAGALILAEIERLDRASLSTQPAQTGEA